MPKVEVPRTPLAEDTCREIQGPDSVPARGLIGGSNAPVQAGTARLGDAVENGPARAATLESLARLRQIPALQSLADGFVRAATRTDVSVYEVVRSVEKDPSLCVRVLKMANSTFVGSEQKIRDIFTAVQMLGMRRVGTLAHVLFTMRDSKCMAGGLDWRHLWVHSLATAAIAEELNRALRLGENPQLYLAALLHDVGKIVLSTVEPERYQAVLAAVLRDGGDLTAQELSQLGVGHGEAGMKFGRERGLPEAVIAAIEWHGDPLGADAHRETVAVVALANYLAKFYGLGFGGALLTPADGDWDTHPAWAMLSGTGGAEPDRAHLAEEMRGLARILKQELAGGVG